MPFKRARFTPAPVAAFRATVRRVPCALLRVGMMRALDRDLRACAARGIDVYAPGEAA
jgi:hypothetical protein